MSQDGQPARHDIPLWGIFLLFLGVVLLLQTVNILPWSLWGTLWRFWPVLLIAAGISILLRHYNYWLISGIILLLFFGCVGLAAWQHTVNPPAWYPGIPAEVQEEMEKAFREIELGCEINGTEAN